MSVFRPVNMERPGMTVKSNMKMRIVASDGGREVSDLKRELLERFSPDSKVSGDIVASMGRIEVELQKMKEFWGRRSEMGEMEVSDTLALKIAEKSEMLGSMKTFIQNVIQNILNPDGQNHNPKVRIYNNENGNIEKGFAKGKVLAGKKRKCETVDGVEVKVKKVGLVSATITTDSDPIKIVEGDQPEVKNKSETGNSGIEIVSLVKRVTLTPITTATDVIDNKNQVQPDIGDLEQQVISHLFIRNIDFLEMNIQSSKLNIQTVLDLIANAKNHQSDETDLRGLEREGLAKVLGLKMIPSKRTETKIESKEVGAMEEEAFYILDPFWFCGRPSAQLLAEKSESTSRCEDKGEEKVGEESENGEENDENGEGEALNSDFENGRISVCPWRRLSAESMKRFGGRSKL